MKTGEPALVIPMGVDAELLDSPDQAQRMGELARRWVRRRFDWENVAAGYGNLLARAMDSGNGPP